MVGPNASVEFWWVLDKDSRSRGTLAFVFAYKISSE